MAQQIIGLGTTDNDGLGNSLKAGGEKINANFGELYLTNVIHINSASDFPAAVGGVIELVPNPGDEITYVVATLDIDIGSDRFTITDGEVVIIGAHRTASMITSTTSGNLFTVVDSGFFPEFMGFDCVNATVVDYSTTVPSFKSFVTQNVIIRDCDKIFNISGAFTTSFRTLTVISSQTGGILWTGTDNSQINISNFLGVSWVGTLLDLGTATFDIINISGDNRFISPSGTAVLSGASGSANLTATGRSIVNDNLFNGSGTALLGINPQDLKWRFSGNVFVDNSTKNTEVVTDSFLTASETVTISTQGVYVAIGGSNWVSDISKRFTVSTAGLITYIGLETIDITISAVSTVSKVGGGSDTICTKIAINGVVQDKTMGCTENTAPTGVTSVGLFEIETGDTIQLFTANLGGTSNVIIGTSSLIIGER